MHVYQQSSGSWYEPSGKLLATGYSGHPPNVNNPVAQNIPDLGPLPEGYWMIGAAFDDPNKGPLVMTLTPKADTETFGRSGFLIHGDSIEFPGAEEASEGCIVLSRSARETINTSEDHQLLVVS